MMRRGSVVFEKNISVVHAPRRISLISYCAYSFARMKSHLEAEYYFFVKQRDQYHRFRHCPTFFGTVAAILFKYTVTTLRRRAAADLLRHPLQCAALVVSCLLEQAYAWTLAPVFVMRFAAGKAGFFMDKVDMQRTCGLWKANTPLSTADFLMKRSIARSLAFPLLRLPVYSAVPALVRLGKSSPQRQLPQCYLRIDDMFLDRTGDIEALCGVLREHHVPFLASITGDQMADTRFSRCLDTIVSSGGEIGLHGFYHQGTFGPFASEILQMTFKEIRRNIERVMERIPGGLRPIAFVPPFNAISREQIYLAGTYFSIVCGGPETARFTDGCFGPLALKNGSLYFPAFFPFYSAAADIMRFKALETLNRLGGIACVTVHMPHEADNGFADVKRLVRMLAKTAVSWKRLIK
jgi:hypothetical protein